ncbi:hypothetical protein GCM10028789_06960 [Sinomonas halotolerans]
MPFAFDELGGADELRVIGQKDGTTAIKKAVGASSPQSMYGRNTLDVITARAFMPIMNYFLKMPFQGLFIQAICSVAIWCGADFYAKVLEPLGDHLSPNGDVGSAPV